jgi:RimJ/RimL family protein N-acetyltransferase
VRNLENWSAVPAPGPQRIEGRYAVLERLSSDQHGAQLYQTFVDQDQVWDHLPYGPFHSAAQYIRWVKEQSILTDPYFYAIRNLETGQLGGVASYLRIDPANGVIEVGHINMSPSLQKTRAGTEAMFLMMQWAFDAGYRRYEWKCNALNLASRRAAIRYGLSYEGVFRQHMITKGRNRDTAWFAAIDAEWPALREAFRAWLHPSNFDANGQQKESLRDLTRLVLVAEDPLGRSERG